ncbi:MAG: hypothetical protein Fur0022_40480 [Anaerolineales bacterium]
MSSDDLDTARFKTSKLDIERLNQYFEKFEFTRLPRQSSKTPEQAALTTWRIVLICLNAEKIPIPLEIYDDILIGRSHGETIVDLDLSLYRGIEMGVSRLHARLRPTRENLLIFDEGSTNGTFCNFKNATIADPLTVANNDILTFGVLNFQLKIVRHPKH